MWKHLLEAGFYIEPTFIRSNRRMLHIKRNSFKTYAQAKTETGSEVTDRSTSQCHKCTDSITLSGCALGQLIMLDVIFYQSLYSSNITILWSLSQQLASNLLSRKMTCADKSLLWCQKHAVLWGKSLSANNEITLAADRSMTLSLLIGTRWRLTFIINNQSLFFRGR